MKVKFLKDATNLLTGETYKKNQLFEFEDEQAEELITSKLVEEIKEDKEPEKAPPKKKAKKKEGEE